MFVVHITWAHGGVCGVGAAGHSRLLNADLDTSGLVLKVVYYRGRCPGCPRQRAGVHRIKGKIFVCRSVGLPVGPQPIDKSMMEEEDGVVCGISCTHCASDVTMDAVMEVSLNLAVPCLELIDSHPLDHSHRRTVRKDVVEVTSEKVTVRLCPRLPLEGSCCD